jgi:hypothetical protein
MKKLCAIGIIFLFIGVAVAPSINSSVVKTSDDLIEVTSQACGIQGFGNTTVKLTKQQYQDLAQYLVDFRARLNQTTTREEAIPLFKDAVVELNKFGLLPKGMSIEEAQKLVTGNYIPPQLQKTIVKLWKKSTESNDKNESVLCLLYGSTSRWITKFVRGTIYLVFWILCEFLSKIFAKILNFISNFVVPFIENHYLLWDSIVLVLLLLYEIGTPIISLISAIFYPILSLIEFLDYQPVRILSTVGLTDASGFVQSQGINGMRQWTGSLTGNINQPLLKKYLDPGIIGFTGLRLMGFDSCTFFGFALLINIIAS